MRNEFNNIFVFQSNTRRRRNEKSKKDNSACHRFDIVFRHVGLLKRGVSFNSNVAILRPGTLPD